MRLRHSIKNPHPAISILSNMLTYECSSGAQLQHIFMAHLTKRSGQLCLQKFATREGVGPGEQFGRRGNGIKCDTPGCQLSAPRVHYALWYVDSSWDLDMWNLRIGIKDIYFKWSFPVSKYCSNRLHGEYLRRCNLLLKMPSWKWLTPKLFKPSK